MILIAENFNSSVPSVAQAMELDQQDVLAALAHRLSDSAADYIDVNAGIFLDRESEKLQALIRTIRTVSDQPLVLDSPSPAVLDQAAELISHKSLRGHAPGDGLPDLLLNSISLEENRYQSVCEIATRHQAGVIALLMDDQGIPDEPEASLQIADRLVNRLRSDGFPDRHIFLDPLVRPVSTWDQAGRQVLQVIRELSRRYPEIQISIGLSNVSFGLPGRRWLNQALLAQAMACGLTCAILNPLDEDLMQLYQACRVMLGQDEWCMDYLNRYRMK